MNKSISIVGSGPNGLTAAILLSNSGYNVRIFESQNSLGGGLRSYINTEFGTLHDICSAVHPLAVISPVFRKMGLHKEVPMVYPEIPYSHAFSTEDLKDNNSVIHKKISTFAGVAAHGMSEVWKPLGISIGLSLSAIGYKVGWPIPIGGSQKIADFLISKINFKNTDIFLNTELTHENYKYCLAGSDGVIWDTIPDTPLKILGVSDTGRKYINGVVKFDFVVSSPIPWMDNSLNSSGTIHLGGSYKKIINGQKNILNNEIPVDPFLVLSQPSLFDVTRSSDGLHTIWGYAQVPANAEKNNFEDLCINRIADYAPGFEDTVINSKIHTPANLEKYNPNYRNGDILSGSTTNNQLLRSNGAIIPWCLPRKNWFICSASVFPGPGVHGLGGYIAAKLLMKNL